MENFTFILNHFEQWDCRLKYGLYEVAGRDVAVLTREASRGIYDQGIMESMIFAQCSRV